MPNHSDDALQRRLARLLEPAPGPSAISTIGEFCLGTSIGHVRTQNQDRALITFASYGDAPSRNFALAVVCDGIGGLSGGDKAATLAISTFVSRVLRKPKLPPSERLGSAAIAANEAVFDQFSGRGGATLSATMVHAAGDITAVNIGDSRIYGLAPSKKIDQLTKDDTLAGYLGRQDQGQDHRNQLVQFVGMGEGIEPHILHLHQVEYDNFLLTSDGVHNSPVDALTQALSSSQTNEDRVGKLLTLSDVLGGRDNATLIAIPSKLAQTHSDQGLTLTFVAPTSRLEIWLPILQDTTRQAVPPSLGEASDMTQAKAPDQPKRNEGSRSAGRDGHRTKNKKKKGRGGSNTGLPLEDEGAPQLEVEFPKDHTD